MSEYAIYVEELRLKYPEERSFIFKDLSLYIRPKQKLLILGPSGSGKSTLLQVLSGIIPSYYEVPIAYKTIGLAQRSGIVFQDPETQFCMSTVAEELAFVLENQSVERDKMEKLMLDVIKLVDLNVDLHTKIATMSQGMKQRLALASILLLEPSVVFLDEPSALLDPAGKAKIWDVLKQTLHQHTVIVVEHDISHSMDWFDRIVVLNDEGNIIADGSPSTVFTNQQQLLDTYGIWHSNSWSAFTSTLEQTKAPLPHLQSCEDQLHNHSTLLRLEDFTVHRDNQAICHIANANVQQGEWITITGKNGAGKSSLLLALAGLLEHTGHYDLQNQRVLFKKKHVPSQISLVFQSPELQFIADTVLDELVVCFADSKQSFRKFLKKHTATYRAYIKEQLEHYYLPIPLDRHPYQCSVGQKKRLSLLTACMNHSNILLLDEPTFGQDARSTFTILNMLLALTKQGITILMITHDLNIVQQFATQQWKIEDGELDVCSPPIMLQGACQHDSFTELVKA